MRFRAWLEDTWFHGSPDAIKQFDYTYIGKGHDQEGPGFYFTSSEEDAKGYGGQTVKAELKLDKVVPLEGEVPAKEIEAILGQAPELKEALSDWGEDYEAGVNSMAFREALNAILQYSTSPHDAFQQVWIDFYARTGHDDQYLKNMTALGYDGVIVPKRNGVVHAVVFSPENIRIL